MPPMVMSVSVKAGSGPGFGIWLPLFLVWPFVLLLFLILLPFVLLADVILAFTQSRFSVTRAVLALYAVTCALRGLSVDVNSRSNNTLVRVSAS